MHTFYPVAALNTHYVLVTTGSAGDLFPFLKLAEGLRQRGASVTFVAPDLHAPMVARSGLQFHGTHADPAVLADPDLWHPKRGFAIVWRAVRPGLKTLQPLVQSLPAGPCVIVAHPLALPEAALCRAQRPGVQVAVVYLAPSNIATVYDPLVMGPWKVPRWIPHAVRRWLWRQVGKRLIDPVVLPDINADRAAVGLAPVNGLFDLMARAPELSVTLFPDWFGPRQPDWPAPLVCGEFALHDPDPDAAFSAELAQFLAAGDAPIVFTHGTGNHQASAYFACALAAVAQLGRRAIFLTGLREQ
ncbi:MAG TPA: glycosyltransferase, partial [Telluria sp.]